MKTLSPNQLDACKKALELLKKGFTKNAFARVREDPQYEMGITSPISPYAKCFCSIGAVCCVYNVDSPESIPHAELHPIVLALVKAAYGGRYSEYHNVGDVYRFNDNHTKEEVIAAWEKMIKENE